MSFEAGIANGSSCTSDILTWLLLTSDGDIIFHKKKYLLTNWSSLSVRIKDWHCFFFLQLEYYLENY
jgi:hypothetical protein